MDFRAFWSAGYIANRYGYAEVYNLDLMKEVQEQMVPGNGKDTIHVAPVSVIPVFFLLFQLFALLPPIPAYYLWSALNLVGFVLYMVFFFRKIHAQNWHLLVLLGLLTFPVFSNLFWGQLDLLLLICMGEFLRNIRMKRDLLAGAWIGGLVLKPQVLVLILPVLLLQRKWKVLSGFSLILLASLTGSILLGKLDALVGVAGIMLQFSIGMPTNAPEFMMNWRMVGEHLNNFLPSGVSWGIAGAGMVMTAVFALRLWSKPMEMDSTESLVAFTGTMAATLALTWHSHVHTAMILLPPILYLATKKIFSEKLFHWWLYCLPLIHLLLVYPLRILDVSFSISLMLIPGLVMFLFNLIFLGWAWMFLHSQGQGHSRLNEIKKL